MMKESIPAFARLTLGVFAILMASMVWGAVPGALEREDAFLAGTLSAILEREFGWARDSFWLEVRDGVAEVTLYREGRERRQSLQSRLPAIDGLQGIDIRLAGREQVAVKRLIAGEQADATDASDPVYSTFGLTPDTIPFPTGDLFRPLLADPKQPQFFVSLRSYDTPDDRVTTGAVGYGETFGLFRRRGREPGDGLQISIAGALFAQFNLDAPSYDLINADYTIGIPVTYRRGGFSARARVYHQSSHLGDEFLLRARPERINLSFESAELLLSYEWKGLRAYGGGEYLFSREPADLDPAGVHFGLEFRGPKVWLWGGRPVGGVDVKRWEEHDWDNDYSIKAGLEFGAAQPGRRRLRVMLEGYDGFAPHGQFYGDPISYYGVGLYLGF